MDRTKAKQIIEALLFASEKPLSIEEIRQVLEEETTQDIRALIDELRDEYEAQARGFRVCEIAGGYQVSTHPDLAPWLKKLHSSRRASRFSKPALETLAIVAYRHPVTRAEIESIRGVNVEGVLKTLLEKEMVKIRGRKDSPGRPIIYGTTNQFLEYFGLKNLSELPTLKELTPPDVGQPQEVKEEIER